MGFFSSAVNSLQDIGGEISGVFESAEDLVNNKEFQQAAAAAAGFVVGGPAGALAAQSTVSAVQQGREASKQAKFAKEQREIQRRQANVRAVRQRAQALRERRLAEAQIKVEAQAQGVSSSSAAAGATSSATQQAVQNLGIINSNVAAQNEMFDIANRISTSQTRQYQLGSYADIGKSVFTYLDRKK